MVGEKLKIHGKNKFEPPLIYKGIFRGDLIQSNNKDRLLLIEMKSKLMLPVIFYNQKPISWYVSDTCCDEIPPCPILNGVFKFIQMDLY